MLKNLLIYRLPVGFELVAGTFEELLRGAPLNPPSGLSLESGGFVPVNDAGQYVVSVEKRFLFEHGVDKKILPGGVVNRAAGDKIKAIEASKGFKLGRKARREVKEQVVAELLPQAFIRRSTVRGWFDTQGGWLVIGTRSPSRGDDVVSGLRNVLGTLAVVPAMPSDVGISVYLTEWLRSGEAEGRFQLEDAVDLLGSDEKGSTVKYNRHELVVDTVKRLIDEGKKVTRLSLSWDDKISLSLTDKLIVEKLALLNIENRQPADDANADDMFAGEFALFSGEIAEMLGEMSTVLKLAPAAEAALA